MIYFILEVVVTDRFHCTIQTSEHYMYNCHFIIDVATAVAEPSCSPQPSMYIHWTPHYKSRPNHSACQLTKSLWFRSQATLPRDVSLTSRPHGHTNRQQHHNEIFAVNQSAGNKLVCMTPEYMLVWLWLYSWIARWICISLERGWSRWCNADVA